VKVKEEAIKNGKVEIRWYSMVGRFERSLLSSSRCYSVSQVQTSYAQNWPMFPPQWFHFLRKVSYVTLPLSPALFISYQHLLKIPYERLSQ